MNPNQFRKEKTLRFVNLSLGLGLTLAFLWLVGMKSTSVARSATFPVTKFTDTNDGTCDADCSLREAIIAANATGDPDTITLMAGTYNLTIGGVGEDAAATGDLDITTPLTISGAGPSLTIIDGGNLNRVFDIRRGNVVISDLTIRNGNAGSAIFGGGVLNEAHLTLINSNVRNNRASSGGGIVNRPGGILMLTNSTASSNISSGNGGGIANFSDMTLANSTVSNNTAIVSGGGISTSGGDLMVINSTIGTNTASSGGGISNSGRVLTMTNSTVSANIGDGIFNTSDSNLRMTNSTVNNNTGNGITNFGSGLTMTSSTVSNNTEDGIFNASGSDLVMTDSTVSNNTGDGITNSGSNLTITNSTVSGNRSSSGGGITNFSSGVVTVTNSTINDNIFSIRGSGINNFSGTVSLKNTIVANNTVDDCLGVIISMGHNLDRDGTCNLVHPGDLADTNPMLGPLQQNGGPTETHAILADSPAIDAADNTTCPASDQRGVKRPMDGDMNGLAACDIGAYEFELRSLYMPFLLNIGDLD